MQGVNDAVLLGSDWRAVQIHSNATIADADDMSIGWQGSHLDVVNYSLPAGLRLRANFIAFSIF
jgi:hypothetical protein